MVVPIDGAGGTSGGFGVTGGGAEGTGGGFGGTGGGGGGADSGAGDGGGSGDGGGGVAIGGGIVVAVLLAEAVLAEVVVAAVAVVAAVEVVVEVGGAGGHKGEGELAALGISLQNFFHLKDDGSGWERLLDSSSKTLINNYLLTGTDTDTDWICLIPSKENIHIWRTFGNRLATKDNLGKRGVVLNSLECQLCCMRDETLDHVIVVCSTTRLVSAYMCSWVKWWLVRAYSVKNLRSEICNGDGEKRSIGKSRQEGH
ncbi:hypothetical protein OSB04_005076 [Centaurea solstitialis]|uniref:Reverse transcriptase zinc-binding domain-containing protein n=1 Tax=Centaurea solstitialis TaxID=347529 RepID=A0AA38TQW5_9ASTR|nr:hypothetical protein OSB04_005076 [Centaurea solstitialis]